MDRFLRLLCACALLALPLAVSGCERAAASATTRFTFEDPPAERPIASDFTATGSVEPTASTSMDSIEPTDSLEPSASAVPSAPTVPPGYPTVTKRPRWAHGFGGLIDGVYTYRRVVALTFDDGPTARTREIVDELDAVGAHATFFWVGSRITSETAEYAVAHGEELANHTWRHPNMRHLTSEEASEQIGWTSARIAEFTGAAPVWFRSPFNRLYSPEFKQIKAHRLLYANYDVTSIDWMKNVTEADVLDKINASLRPGGVILMHDSPKHDPVYLPAVLRLLKQRGYRVVTMTALAQMGRPVKEPLVLGVRGLGH